MQKFTLSLAASLCMGLTSGSYAAAPPVKIGILTDMSGTYAAMGGPGSVVAAKLAVEDCLKAECKGMDIDVVSADNQNKARSEERTSELQSLMRNSYAVFCLKKKNNRTHITTR